MSISRPRDGFLYHPIITLDRTPHKNTYNYLYYKALSLVRYLRQTALTPHKTTHLSEPKEASAVSVRSSCGDRVRPHSISHSFTASYNTSVRSAVYKSKKPCKSYDLQGLSWVEGGTRTHDIQNHNLTL